jgi:hypothetical protein
MLCINLTLNAKNICTFAVVALKTPRWLIDKRTTCEWLIMKVEIGNLYPIWRFDLTNHFYHSNMLVVHATVTDAELAREMVSLGLINLINLWLRSHPVYLNEMLLPKVNADNLWRFRFKLMLSQISKEIIWQRVNEIPSHFKLKMRYNNRSELALHNLTN